MNKLALISEYKIHGTRQQFVAKDHYKKYEKVGALRIRFLDEALCFNSAIVPLEETVPSATIAAYRVTAAAFDYSIVQDLWELGRQPLGRIAYGFTFQNLNLAGTNPTTLTPQVYTICHVPVNGVMYRPYWHLRDDNPESELGWCYGAGTCNVSLYRECHWCQAAGGMAPVEPWGVGTVVLCLA